MSSSNCCFLTCTQISQEAGQVIWYSHLFQNFPQFVVIHTIKGFGIINKAEVDVFLVFSCFFNDPTDVGNLTSGSSAFSKSSLNIWKFMDLLACEMSTTVQKFEHSLALPFFGIGMKTDLFQSCDHYWVFHICWHIECSTFTASSFSIWNSSTGIPSPPLALFIVMLPRAHLALHSRMSGSRWVITPSWLSGSWRSFLYSSSAYSCHLFLISSESVRSILFLSFIELIFAWNVALGSLIFLKRSLVFPILLFSSISLHWSLRKAFFSLLAILWISAFQWIYLSFSLLLFTSLLFTAVCKVSSDSHFTFLHFFFLGVVLILVSCTMSRNSTIVLQALCLSDLIP